MTELTIAIMQVLVLVLATEAVTEIICDSELTSPIRQWWKRWTYRTDKPPVDYDNTITKSSVVTVSCPEWLLKYVSEKLALALCHYFSTFLSYLDIKTAASKSLYLHRFKVFVDKLISCGYCTSVWVSGFFALWAPSLFQFDMFVNWMVMLFAIHRLSNWLHVIYKLVLNGRIKTFDLLVKQVKEDGSSGES